MGYGDQNLNLPGNLNFAPDPARVKELVKLMHKGPFHLGRPCTDRASWGKVKATTTSVRLLDEAREAAKAEPQSRVTNEDCLRVIETGERVELAQRMKLLRDRQVLPVIAECLEPNGGYLPMIEEDVQSVCALNSWSFPAPEDGKKFYERKAIFTDLASVHHASNLVNTLHLLGDRLRPETRELIRREVDARIFQPFEERIKTGHDMFWWLVVSHNWNSVCLASILSCALSLKDSREERAWYVAVVEKLIKHSEDGFEPSGFYTEGVGYWVYGFSHYVIAAELVRGVTGGKIDWLKKPRVERVSHFGHRMEIQQGVYPSFADCQREARPPQWLMNWLNNRIDPERVERRTEQPIPPCDMPHFQFAEAVHLLLFHQVDLNQAYAIEGKHAPYDWFDDVQFLISRPVPGSSSRLAATFKGGHNGVNHNHNDLGTFTVISGREELLVDPGAEVYTGRTFGINRYESDLLNSFGHPVPVVAREGQFPDKTYHRSGYGRDAYTLVADTSFTDEHDRVIIEMDRAYKVRHLKNLIRGFTYERTGQGAVEVWDQVSFERPDSYETALLTYAEWKMGVDGKLRVSANGEAVEVEVTSEQGELEFGHGVIQESSTPTRFSWRFKSPILSATVRIRVTPTN